MTAAWFHDITRVDRFLLTGDRSDVLQRLADVHARLEAHELGRHDPARRARWILEQSFQFLAQLRRQFRNNQVTRMMAHALDHVGAFIRRKTGEYFRGAVRLEMFEDRGTSPHKWI